MEIQRGFRSKLKNHIDVSKEFTLEFAISGPVQCSYCCMAVTAEDVPYCSDYIIWSGHTHSPKSELIYQDVEQGAICTVNLQLMPSQIKKLVFLINIEDEHVMGDIDLQKAELQQDGRSIFVFQLKGQDFRREKLVVCCEVYKKGGEWRFAALSCGYNKTISEIVEEKKASTQLSSEQVSIAPSAYLERKKTPPRSKTALTIKGHILAEPFSTAIKSKRKTSTNILPTKVIPLPISRKKKSH